MPLYSEDIKPKEPVQGAAESEVVKKLLEYTDEKHNPARVNYLKTIEECYNFKELRQWAGSEKSILTTLDVPDITPDRINRALKNLNGMKNNANLNHKVTKGESGDVAIAEVLQKQLDFVIYNSEFQQSQDEAWSNLKDVGIGLRKFGWDASLMGGEGMLWYDSVNIEDCGWSYTRKKNWSDVRFIWQKSVMDWQDAIRLNPAKAPELNSLKVSLTKEWDNLKDTHPQTGTDYSGETRSTSTYEYPDSVTVWEIWVKRTIPFKKIEFIQEVPVGIDALGNMISASIKSAKKTPIDYELQEGEAESSNGTDEVWYQHIVASGKDKSGAFLMTPVDGVPYEFDFPPYVPCVIEYKKDGSPRGMIEMAIPHQKRINVSYAQKIAFNNKAIKSPLVIETLDGQVDLATMEKQSQFGGIMVLTAGQKLQSVNAVPNVNLQSIEESNEAKQDMEFAIASIEPTLQGHSNAGDSGIKVAQLQSAAVTPLNEWVKAVQSSDELLLKRTLKIIAKKFTPERMARIVGRERLMQLLPIGVIPQINFDAYDVTIKDEAISDLNKQQSFNAIMAMQQMSMGGMFDDEFIIESAPIKNTDEALMSHQRKRQDIMNTLIMENQLLKAALGQAEKGQKSGGGQANNAMRGKNHPQSGKQKMLGGQLGVPA